MYPEDRMYQEMSFLAYYYHWSMKEVTELPHRIRRRWCEEISRLHRELEHAEGKERNLFEPGYKAKWF